MEPFRTRIAALEAEGYANGPAQAKLAHDIVLAALAMSGAAPHVAVKGGVLMGSLTGDVRRATMDLDIDFVRRPLSDESVDERRLRRFVALLVFDDPAMRERDFAAVAARVRGVFSSGLYRKKLAGRKANWLEITPDEAMNGLLSFLDSL